jgi:hypothetical protein
MSNHSQKLRSAAKSPSGIPSGVELMRRINEGSMETAPAEYIREVRNKVVDACEELLDIGARIRPLIVNKKQIGWVRGIHNTERRVLSRWLYDTNDYIYHVLLSATTLTSEQIEEMPAMEIRNLIEVVKTMSDYDVSLFPYLSAFITTMTSENLWHGKGQRLSSFENRMVALPDGKQMKIIVPADHSRLWATLATYREQAKKRLDESWNAVLIVRPWVGHNADPISADLKNLSRHLQTDSMEPWESIVRVEARHTNVNDGWAHAEDSAEGLYREMQRMISHDRHERLMETFEKQQIEQAEEQRRRMEKIIFERGGVGVTSQVISAQTEAQVREQERSLKKGNLVPPIVTRDEREVQSNPADKIKKYR